MTSLSKVWDMLASFVSLRPNGRWNLQRIETQNEADFAFLQSKGVKYILNLRLFPFLSASEGRKAKAHGMTLITATIDTDFILGGFL